MSFQPDVQSVTIDGSILAAPSLLAQAAPPLSGASAAPATGATGAPTGGGTGAPVGGGAQQPAGAGMLFFMFGAIALLMLFTYMGNRRETKRKKEMLESLKRNDRVQTVGGIIGSIVEVKPEVVVLRVDENSNTRVTFARSAVVGVVRESTTEPSKADGKSDGKTDGKS